MKKDVSLLNIFSRSIALAFLLSAIFSVHATPTFWTGPAITFIHTNAGPTVLTNWDELTTNHVGTDSTNNVFLMRGAQQPLYNAAAESAWNATVSPVHTLWALSNSTTMKLTNANTFTYGIFANVVGKPGHSPGLSVGKTFFVHIVPDDIYLSLKLTAWGNDNGGSFQYIRSTPAAVTFPPTVGITNPVSGTLFVALANVTIQASASETNGTIASVQFRIGTGGGTNILATQTTPPFSATTNNLAAGNYTLIVIATDSLGITATNSINITVDSRPTVSITSPTNNTTLSAPANVTIQASASDGDGSVTNVQFIVGSTVLTNDNSAPFSGTTNNLSVGNYNLSAIAFDNFGFTTTNSISINVVTPVTVTLSNSATIASTNFQFKYAANVGLNYVVQVSTNLASGNWISLATNVAASNPVVFVDAHATNKSAFYRVGRLPNP